MDGTVIQPGAGRIPYFGPGEVHRILRKIRTILLLIAAVAGLSGVLLVNAVAGLRKSLTRSPNSPT